MTLEEFKFECSLIPNDIWRGCLLCPAIDQIGYEVETRNTATGSPKDLLVDNFKPTNMSIGVYWFGDARKLRNKIRRRIVFWKFKRLAIKEKAYLDW